MMQMFMTRLTQGHQVVQAVFFSVCGIFGRGKLGLWRDMVRVQMILGSAQETFRQHEPLVVPGDLDFFFGSTHLHRNAVAVGKGLLDKGRGQSHRLGNLDPVQIVPTPLVQGSVVAQTNVFYQNLLGLGVHAEMTDSERRVSRDFGDLGHRVQMRREKKTQLFLQKMQERRHHNPRGRLRFGARG